MVNNDFFHYDKTVTGVKGLIIIGNKFLVYRRDGNTKNHPYELDLIGGGSESNESPYVTFRREALEESGLQINKNHVISAGKHESASMKGTYVYFVVVKLKQSEEINIRWGDEGSEYMLLEPDEYFARKDAWKFFQERAKSYYDSLN